MYLVCVSTMTLALLLVLFPKYLQVVASALMLYIWLSVNPPRRRRWRSAVFPPVAAPLPLSESSSTALKHSFKPADVLRALQLRWSLISSLSLKGLYPSWPALARAVSPPQSSPREDLTCVFSRAYYGLAVREMMPVFAYFYFSVFCHKNILFPRKNICSPAENVTKHSI